MTIESDSRARSTVRSSGEAPHARLKTGSQAPRQRGGVTGDARIIARHADGVLLTVAAGKEKPSVLTSAIETLQLAGAKISGIVLNFADDALASTEGYQPEAAPRQRTEKQVAKR